MPLAENVTRASEVLTRTFVACSATLPLLRSLIVRSPVSPPSRMPLCWQESTLSSSVTASTVMAPPSEKSSVPPRFAVEKRSGEMALTPAPRLANACQNSL